MKTPRKRNPVARVVKTIRPKVVPDKRRKKMEKAISRLDQGPPSREVAS